LTSLFFDHINNIEIRYSETAKNIWFERVRFKSESALKTFLGRFSD